MPMRFSARVLIGGIGLWIASAIVPGIHLEGGWTLIGAAFLFGLANAVVKPIAVILTLPITILSLGFFLLVINAAMLGLVASLLDRFSIDGFFSALLGAIVVSVVGWFASWSVGSDGRVEVIRVEDRHRD